MRTLMKVSSPSRPETGRSWTEACRRSYRRSPRTRPEAAYFTAENGLRDRFSCSTQGCLDDSGHRRAVLHTFGAAITWSPCMNAAELKAGLEKLAAKSPKAARKERRRSPLTDPFVRRRPRGPEGSRRAASFFFVASRAYFANISIHLR